jgi:hypothetical protein
MLPTAIVSRRQKLPPGIAFFRFRQHFQMSPLSAVPAYCFVISRALSA